MKRIIIPFDAREVKLTGPYGSRTLNGKANFHAGYDLVGIGSRNVTAAVGGTVVVSRIITDKSNRTWEWGNYVCIRGDDGRQYYYCHLASRAVAKGARINAGDKLGVMGSTGYSFGAHLHFEVREADGRTTVNPEAVLGIPNREGVYTAVYTAEVRLPMPHCGISWNQRQTSACVAFALTMALRVKLYSLTNKWIDLDPLTLYKASGAKNGASVSPLAGTLHTVGVCNTADGKRYKAGAYKSISGYDAICAEIDVGNPVAIALNVDKFFGKRPDGIEPLYPKSSTTGHAVCVIGYTYMDGRRYLIVKNSHGDPLQNGGLVYIPETRTLKEAVALTDTSTGIARKAKTVTLTVGCAAASVDGKDTSLPVAPYIKNDRLLAPVRAVADALGCTVAWDAASGTATLTSEEGILALRTGSDRMTVDGKAVQLDAAPEIIGSGTMMLPVRYIAEALRCKVAWEASTRTATITAI